MRSDGAAMYYLVQHKASHLNEWAESALEHMLFGSLDYDQARGALGDRYRELLHPQSANSSLWQKYGLHGFLDRADADAMLVALRDRRPDQDFRLVRRTIMQQTEVVA